MTAARRLYVVNQSTLVSTADARRMTAACNKQLRDHIAPTWGLGPVVVSFHAGDLATVQQEAPAGSWVIALLDDSDQAGALGWHWVDDKARVYGEVFAKPSIDAGSSAFGGKYPVSTTLSHEVGEMRCDVYCGGWEDSGRGFLLAREIADPVEADSYDIDGVPVSNFVTPAYFDSTAADPGPYDHMGKLSQAWSMTPGGYWVQMKAGTQTQQFKRTAEWIREAGFDVRGSQSGPQLVFSPEMPEWRREEKLAGGRNAAKRARAA